MTKRRSRGDGGLYWDENRQRYTAEVTIGFSPAGKRIVRKARGRTKTEAQKKLKEMIRELDDGDVREDRSYTVADAVNDWLTYGLNRRSDQTITTLTILAKNHVIPSLGARKLRELSAEEVDKWLAGKAKELSTRTVRDVRSILKRSIARAQARDKVKRNVVLLCDVPSGQQGRPSKSLSFAQAEALLAAAERSPMCAYIVVSLLTGARTEELRALTWDHVDLTGDPDATPPVPPHIRVWRSVRATGDTKTPKSRRSLALPQKCIEALEAHKTVLTESRRLAGGRWHENNLVFPSAVGTELDAANVRRDFRKVAAAAGLDAKQWTPRELRHSFVSLLSDNGLTIEQISRLVGHRGTAVTELVYRHEIRPVVEHGATAMNRIFPERLPDEES